MSRFDVKSLVERARKRPLPVTDRGVIFNQHLKKNSPWCACAFSMRRFVTCQCCGQTLCFMCGGVTSTESVSEHLNNYNSAFQGPFEFDDCLKDL